MWEGRERDAEWRIYAALTSLARGMKPLHHMRRHWMLPPHLLAIAATATLAACGERGSSMRGDSIQQTMMVDSGSVATLPRVTRVPSLSDTAPAAAPNDTGPRADSARAATSPARAPARPGTTSAKTEPAARTTTSPTSAIETPPADSTQGVPVANARLLPAPPTPTPPQTGGAAADHTAAPAETERDDELPVFPFNIGERLDYQVKFGPVSVGSATMEVVGVETLRGRQVYHTRFVVKGGTLFYKVNDRYESWFDPRDDVSLRFKQQIDEGTYEAERTYEIFPERRVYVENDKPEQPSVGNPLDEAALIYYMRTMPLEMGETYDLDRYFKPDRNPVRVQVLRRERVTTPAGTFNTIVVRPSIKAKGIFSEGGKAEVWFTDDSVRTMVQMKSQLKFGSLNLYLKSVREGRRP